MGKQVHLVDGYAAEPGPRGQVDELGPPLAVHLSAMYLSVPPLDVGMPCALSAIRAHEIPWVVTSYEGTLARMAARPDEML